MHGPTFTDVSLLTLFLKVRVGQDWLTLGTQNFLGEAAGLLIPAYCPGAFQTCLLDRATNLPGVGHNPKTYESLLSVLRTKVNVITLNIQHLAGIVTATTRVFYAGKEDWALVAHSEDTCHPWFSFFGRVIKLRSILPISNDHHSFTAAFRAVLPQTLAAFKHTLVKTTKNAMTILAGRLPDTHVRHLQLIGTPTSHIWVTDSVLLATNAVTGVMAELLKPSQPSSPWKHSRFLQFFPDPAAPQRVGFSGDQFRQSFLSGQIS